MTLTHPPSRLRRLLAVLTVGGLLFAACGNSDDDGDDSSATTEAPTDVTSGDGDVEPITDVPGVTDEEIRFAAFGTNSNNPLGTCNLDCFVDGIEAYFAFRNSEGGVHGRELVLTTELDDELANNQQRALEILSADDTFAAFSAAQIPTGWAAFADAGVPLYVWAIHFAEMAGRESVFGNAGVRCTLCSARGPIYAATLKDATTVAAMGYGASQASKDCAASNVGSVERYGDDTGLTVGYENANLDFGLPNGIGPEVTAMKDAGVDFVMACIDLNGMKTLAQEMARQGMGDVPMVHSNTYDSTFVAGAEGVFDGDIISVLFRPFEADPAGSQLADFFEWMEETGSEITEPALVGWVNADLAYQGLLAAGPQFDQAAVIAATNEMTEYTAGGIIPPIDWTRQHEPPTEDDRVTHGDAKECVAFVDVVDGAFELAGEPDAPWMCWDGADRAWSDPEPTNFD
jgi:hypothetical protein